MIDKNEYIHLYNVAPSESDWIQLSILPTDRITVAVVEDKCKVELNQNIL